MLEGTNFDKLLGRLRMTEGFVRLDASITEGALQSIRTEFDANSNLFDRHRAICAQIGATDHDEWRRMLMKLRDEFEAQTLAATISEIEQMFDRSQEVGWTAWLTALAEAVSRFHSRFATGLCKHAFPFDSSREQAVKEIRRAVECMRQDRWEEVYEEIAFLANQESLPTILRARLVAIRAQIEFLRFKNLSRARPLLEEAVAIAPNDGWIVASLGDYWLAEEDAERAVAFYQRAIELAPKDASSYTGMGDRFKKDGRLDEAEAWYRKAIKMAGGDALGYGRLLSVFGHPKNLKTHEDDFLSLLKKRIDVDPDIEYDAYISAGGYYLAANRVSEARRWYDKAIVLKKDWPGAYIELAELCKNQGNADEAKSLYKKAIEVACEYPMGYLLLGRIYEEESRWPDALRVYEACPRRPRQWVSFVRASVGRMHANLGNYEEAERILFNGLLEEQPSDVTQRYAEGALEEIAADHYRGRSDKESAKRIYDKILQARGTEYAGRYHNMLGNLHYFVADYKSAVNEYQKAITAAPDMVAYYRYLSSAYKSLGKYENAERELDRAYQIDKDEKLLQEGKATLANTQGNRAYENAAYSEAVKHYERAIEFASSEAVYHANLALALGQVKETGKRMYNLDHAVRCYERARELSKRESYTEQINQLRRRQAIMRVYGEKALDYLNVLTPITVEVAGDLIPFVEGATQDTLSEELASSVSATRARVMEQLGVRIPSILFRGNETDLLKGTYIVMINEIPLVSGNLSPERQFCTGSGEILSGLDVKGEPASDPVSGQEGFWIDRKDWEKVKSQKLELWGITRYLMRHVEAVVRKNISEFLGHQEIVNLLDGESATSLTEIRASSRMVTALTTVCKALLAEEVPIRPFQEVCTTFKDLHAKDVGLRDIVERIRVLPTFRERLPGNDGQHSYIKLSTRFEAEIRHGLYERDGRLILAMEPERCQEALTAVRNQVKSRSLALVLVVEDAVLRPFVRKLVELEFPNLHVLSRAELRNDAEFVPTGLVDLDGEPLAEHVEFKNPQQVDARGADPEKGRGRTAFALSDIRVEAFVGEDFDTQGSTADDMPIAEIFSMMRDGLFYELGIILPEVQLRTDRNLKSGEFRIRLNGVEHQPVTGLGHDEFLVNDTVDRLTLLGIKGRETVNPANGSECAIVPDDQGQAETCKQAGLTTWGPWGYLVLCLSSEIRKAAARFQTDDVTQYILDSLGRAFPDLVRLALERYTLPQISLLLRELLNEEISIRDLCSILESLVSIDGTTDVDLSRFVVFFVYTDVLCPAIAARDASHLTPSQLTDFVRTSLRRYLSHKYTRGGNTLVVYLVDPAIEQRIADVGARPLTEQEDEKLRAAIRAEARSVPSSASSPVLLTTFEVRRALRKIVEHEFPRLDVLSYQDLSPEMNIQPIARISWD